MENYHNYVANSLYLHGKGQSYTKTMYEMTRPKKNDNRTGGEIAVDVINKLGLTFKE